MNWLDLLICMPCHKSHFLVAPRQLKATTMRSHRRTASSSHHVHPSSHTISPQPHAKPLRSSAQFPRVAGCTSSHRPCMIYIHVGRRLFSIIGPAWSCCSYESYKRSPRSSTMIPKLSALSYINSCRRSV
jgi:hypothetical protein